jgi:hypothetical protein
VRAVLEHQGGDLRDDATLLLVQWTAPDRAPTADAGFSDR